jgi:hypothetical protein
MQMSTKWKVDGLWCKSLISLLVAIKAWVFDVG